MRAPHGFRTRDRLTLTHKVRLDSSTTRDLRTRRRERMAVPVDNPWTNHELILAARCVRCTDQPQNVCPHHAIRVRLWTWWDSHHSEPTDRDRCGHVNRQRQDHRMRGRWASPDAISVDYHDSNQLDPLTESARSKTVDNVVYDADTAVNQHRLREPGDRCTCARCLSMTARRCDDAKKSTVHGKPFSKARAMSSA